MIIYYTFLNDNNTAIGMEKRLHRQKIRKMTFVSEIFS